MEAHRAVLADARPAAPGPSLDLPAQLAVVSTDACFSLHLQTRL